MALETGTYISDLVATNPVVGDNASEGDDHIRLIKSAVKTTFPNVSGAITATHTELNYTVGLTSAAQTQITALAKATQNTQNANYTLDLTDANGHIYKSNSTAYAWTIPPNSSKAFAIGTVIMLVNAGSAGAITVTRGSGVVLRWMNGVGTDANRTLGVYGWALLLKVATDTWLIGGSALT